MRMAFATIGVLLLALAAIAQDATASDADIRAIRSSLLKPAPLLFTIPAPVPDLNAPTMKLGPFTILSPDTHGDVLKLQIPIGEYVMRTKRAISHAWKQHQERTIRKRVQQELRDVEAQIAANRTQ